VVVKSPEEPENSTFGLHRVLKDWGEGDKQDFSPGGQPATEGESSWLARMAPDELWAMPGGMAGEDYVTGPSSTERIFGNGSYVFEFGSVSIASDLQFWLQNPEQNFGWMLITDMEDRGLTARRFGARENASNPPLLTIEFTVGSDNPEPPVITQILLENGDAIITFTTEPDVIYTLQTKESISSENWLDSQMLGLTGDGNELSFSVDLGSEAMQFFRVKAENVTTQ
jgi:hypothetical protein